MIQIRSGNPTKNHGQDRPLDQRDPTQHMCFTHKRTSETTDLFRKQLSNLKIFFLSTRQEKLILRNPWQETKKTDSSYQQRREKI